MINDKKTEFVNEFQIQQTVSNYSKLLEFIGNLKEFVVIITDKIISYKRL